MTTAQTFSAGSAVSNSNRLFAAAGLAATFFGFATGWKGYRTFTALNGLDDAALASRGLSRADLPQVALAAMKRKG